MRLALRAILVSSDLCRHEVVTKEMQTVRRKRLALKYGSGVLGTGAKSKLKAIPFLVWSALSTRRTTEGNLSRATAERMVMAGGSNLGPYDTQESAMAAPMARRTPQGHRILASKKWPVSCSLFLVRCTDQFVRF